MHGLFLGAALGKLSVTFDDMLADIDAVLGFLRDRVLPELGDEELFDRIAAPALVDALTGAIYEVGPGTIGKTSYALPIYDSPLLLMDGSLATGKGKE